MQKINEEIDSLKQGIFCQRDTLFFAAGIAATLFFSYAVLQPEYYTLTWREVIISIVAGGTGYGLWYWADSVLAEAWSNVTRVKVNVETHIIDMVDHQYRAGYRAGVSAANNDSIDPEFM